MYFDELEVAFISLQEKLKPQFVIEVGAREAKFSLTMKKLLPESDIYAFEANPSVFHLYEDECKKTGVNYVQLGVSDYAGVNEFQINLQKEILDGSHSFLKRVDCDNFDQVLVDCVTLDEYFLPKVIESDNVCLWIDAEGFSGQILEGAEKLLSQVQSIYIEVEHSRFWQNQMLSSEVSKFLESRDFYLLGRDLEYFPVQENYLFLNPWRAKFV